MAGPFFGNNIKVGTRRSDDLGYNDTFCTVDNECPGRGHQREISKEDVFPLGHDFTGVLIHYFQFHLGFQRGTVVRLTVLALTDGEFRFSKFIIQKLQFDVSGVVVNGIDIVEYLPDAFPYKPLKGRCLDLDEIRQVQSGTDFGVITPDSFVAIMHNVVCLFIFHVRHPFACIAETPKRGINPVFNFSAFLQRNILSSNGQFVNLYGYSGESSILCSGL